MEAKSRDNMIHDSSINIPVHWDNSNNYRNIEVHEKNTAIYNTSKNWEKWIRFSNQDNTPPENKALKPSSDREDWDKWSRHAST